VFLVHINNTLLRHISLAEETGRGGVFRRLRRMDLTDSADLWRTWTVWNSVLWKRK